MKQFANIEFYNTPEGDVTLFPNVERGRESRASF